MKRKAFALFEQVVTLLMAAVKAKSVATKNKVGVIKARIELLGLFQIKKVLMSAIPTKIHALMNNNNEPHKAIVPYKGAMANKAFPPHPLLLSCHEGGDDATDGGIINDEDEDEDEDRYPDLRHSLFDEEENGLREYNGSIIALVKNARGEEEGEFVLEDEIDNVADMFIRRFHMQMRLQKLQSFRNSKEMIERSV